MQSDIDTVLVSMEVTLGALHHKEVRACSIFSVPDNLRYAKEEAYMPKVISLGPLHRGATRQLQLREEIKWHYMHHFLNRLDSPEFRTRNSQVRLKECCADILMSDAVIRASYGGNIESGTQEFAKIMVVDGCFLLEFLIKLGEHMQSNPESQTRPYADDPIFGDEVILLSVLYDITMIENQIPFIVLKKLYRKVFLTNTELKNDNRVVQIVGNALSFPLKNLNTAGGAHILHLMHLSNVRVGVGEGQPTFSTEKISAKKELLRCATMLRAAGIKIGCTSDSRSQNQNQQNNQAEERNQNQLSRSQNQNFVDCFEFDIDVKGESLIIPALHVKETTEVIWRNLIAWEQGSIGIKCKCTAYAMFFNGLICCKHDIELLVEKGVIVNVCNKSKEDLLTLFRTISMGVEHMDSTYSDICKRLNEYKRKQVERVCRGWPLIVWHQCRRGFEIVVYLLRNSFRILIRDHMPTVWKTIGVLSGAALLALTIAQVVYAVKAPKSSPAQLSSSSSPSSLSPGFRSSPSPSFSISLHLLSLFLINLALSLHYFPIF